MAPSTDEQAVLGAALAGRAGYPGVLSLTAADWSVPRHRKIAAVMQDLVRRNHTLDVTVVADELASRSQLRDAGGSLYLTDLLSAAPVPAMGAWYADRVRAAARVRAATDAAETLVEALRSEGAEARFDELLAAHSASLGSVPPALRADEDELPTVRRLLAKEFADEAWIIPGLLERQERVMITGGEGQGKSTLLKQIGVCCAAGLNPWNGRRVAAGARVLYVDAELSERQNARAYSMMKSRVSRHPLADQNWDANLNHFVRNDGVDLAGRDREWFHHIANRISPDVIIVGPVYKLINGSESDQEVIAGLQRVLDEVRVQHDAALIIETHSPHGSDPANRPVRPVGSSLWLRWPEIGFGFRRDTDANVDQRDDVDQFLKVVAWRGQRDARDWPDLIEWGSNAQLPWVPGRPDWRPSVDTGYTVPKGEIA